MAVLYNHMDTKRDSKPFTNIQPVSPRWTGKYHNHQIQLCYQCQWHKWLE